MHNRRKTALITGASLGIGRELAKLFATAHYDLVLAARDAARLSALANELQQQFGINSKTFPLDLAANSAPQFLFDQVSRENLGIDVLVNNAGFGKLGAFSEASIEDSLGQIQLNMVALTHLTKLFLGPMLERNSGKILNVASTAAQIKAGKLRPLALVNHQRLPEFPDVPTMQEIGYPGVGTIAWQGLFAPAGTPKEVLETIFKASVQALDAPPVVDAFKKQNFNIVPNKSLDDAKAWLADEIKTWKDITSQVKVEAAE